MSEHDEHNNQSQSETHHAGNPEAKPGSFDPDRFYFRQLLSGLDFGAGDQVAEGMANFAYLIGDRASGECVVVDPAYAVAELKAIAEADGMQIAGALVTHYHPDHCGGEMMGISIEGASQLLDIAQVPIHVQSTEKEWILKSTSLSATDLALHDPGDVVTVGELPIQLIHTPGHTPGSQCFLVNGCLVSGDTLFLDGCGRTDLPGGDPEALYYSLTQTLSQVPDDSVLFPGHNYSSRPAQRMGDTRRNNRVFMPDSAEQWLAMFG
ncbi:MAG TPA: MBL fold metallo-hydrolase [Microthrixaceae bacterium]|nr:MBL fold metallo-hydrolase [Microthrixaceae bacterium]